MLRFISHIFKLSYEPCKGCDVLRTQLEITNQNNKELTQTLLNLLNPKVIEATTREILPIKQNLTTFTKRREMLEAEDRNKAKVMLDSKFIARVDDVMKVASTKVAGKTVDINELEKELAIEG